MSKAKARTTDAGKRKQVMPSRPSRETDLLDVRSSMPRLSQYQKFTPHRVARRDLVNAEYNPRQIDKSARKELERIIKKKGLIQAITWNKRTGNIVGGHQRVAILDTLERSMDYSLDVDMIDCSLEEEKEFNLILNNPEIQGVFDPFKLEGMFSSGVDFQAAGFSSMTVQTLFPEAPQLASMLSAERAPEPVKRDLAALQELSEQPRTASGKKRQADETPEERVERMRREKKEHREKAQEREDTENYAVVFCRDRADREDFMESLGLGRDERNVDVRVVRARMEQA